MTLEQAIAKMNELQTAQHAYNHAMGVLSLDGDTAAPSASAKGRGETMGYLSGVTYQLLVNDEVKEALETILANKESVTPVQVRQAELFKEDYDDSVRIPMEEYVEYSTLITQSNAVWHEAKEKNNYASFAPYLEKIINYNRKFAAYKDDKKPAYDVLLDGFEKGASTATLDPFFGLLREELSPVIKAVAEKPEPDTSFFQQKFALADQRIFSDRLMEMMGLDRNRCGIAETEHPFTTNFNKWDVRITTHYNEMDAVDSMYSVIHEGGHALYELGTADDIQFTNLASGASMGLHESQSRFYENLLGRSRAFVGHIFPKMCECFPEQMKGYSAEDVFRAINLVKPSLIRTEADEVTYCLHVMVRYELEKRIMSDELEVKDLPREWNKLYKEYLGVDVPNDTEGVLQDSHWSGGSVGYFPSYALGSAYGAQLLRKMKETVNVEECLLKGDFTPINEWNKEHIWKYGCLMNPGELLEKALGEKFDPFVYTDYLEKKYGEIYGL